MAEEKKNEFEFEDEDEEVSEYTSAGAFFEDEDDEVSEITSTISAPTIHPDNILDVIRQAEIFSSIYIPRINQRLQQLKPVVEANELTFALISLFGVQERRKDDDDSDAPSNLFGTRKYFIPLSTI